MAKKATQNKTSNLTDERAQKEARLKVLKDKNAEKMQIKTKSGKMIPDFKLKAFEKQYEKELGEVQKDFRKDESFPPLQKKDVVLSGHTHIPITEPTDGGLFFNPGSVSIPKNGSKNGYMTLENGLFIWKSFEDGEYARYKL